MRPTLALGLVLVFVSTSLAGCQERIPEPDPKPISRTTEESEPELMKLETEDVKVGDGAEAKKGDTVKVHYTGRLLRTKLEFDSSKGKEPFGFTIGEGEVIKGWDQGVVGMKVGGKRTLRIPADLAYGKEGSPPKIPANAPLLFDVELVSVEGADQGDSADSRSESDTEAAKTKGDD